MIEGNLLIRASAGTGKTFSLATRYIRLMLLDGVAPERIVALTFMLLDCSCASCFLTVTVPLQPDAPVKIPSNAMPTWRRCAKPA